MNITYKLTDPANAIMAIGLVSFVASLLYLGNETLFPLILGTSIVLIVAPPFLKSIKEYNDAKIMELYLPDFLREVAEGNNAGMPLPKAIATAAESNYGPLTKQMRIVASQVSWGTPFDVALMRLTQRTKSSLIKQTMGVIVESYKAGGDIASILETVSEDIRSIKAVEADRKSKFSGNIAVTYVIFLLFLAILAGLANFLIPQMSQFSAFSPAIGGDLAPPTEAEYKVYFFHLVLISAFFSGLVAGYMSENSFFSGLRHSFILIVITILIGQVVFTASPLYEQIGREISSLPPTGLESLELVGNQGTSQEPVENTYKSYLVTNDVTTDEIIDYVNRQIEAGQTFFKENLTASQVEFRQEECEACEAGDITIRKHRLLVSIPTKLGYRVTQEGNEYVVVIRHTTESTSVKKQFAQKKEEGTEASNETISGLRNIAGQ